MGNGLPLVDTTLFICAISATVLEIQCYLCDAPNRIGRISLLYPLCLWSICFHWKYERKYVKRLEYECHLPCIRELLIQCLYFFLLSTAGPVYIFKLEDMVYCWKDHELVDSVFLDMDTALFSWLCPECGQISQWVDSYFLNYDEIVGDIMYKIMHLLYLTYSVWPSVFCVLLGNSYYNSLRRGHSDWIYRYTEIRVALQVFSSVILLSLIISLIFPTASPRIFVAYYYIHELRSGFPGLYYFPTFYNYFSFPAWDIAIPWISALIAELYGWKRFACANRLGAVWLTFASVFIGYHYLSDLVLFFVLIRLGLYITTRTSSKGPLFSFHRTQKLLPFKCII